MGEITATLKYWAKHNQLNLTIVRTNSYSEFKTPIGLDNCDAVICVLNAIHPNLMLEIERRNIPAFEVACSYYTNYAVETIISNNTQGSLDAFEHLYNLGHRKIGFVADFSISDMAERFNGYKLGLEKFDLPFDPSLILEVSEPSVEGGRLTGNTIVEQKLPATAYIAASDLIALGMLQVFDGHNITCPGDIAIVGYEATSLGWNHSPRITSVDQKIFNVIKVTFERIIARLNGAAFESTPFIVEQQLYIGQSSGAQLSEQMSGDEFWRKKSNEVSDFDFATTKVNQNESVLAFTKAGFESILSASYLFGPFLTGGVRAFWVDEDVTKGLKITKEFSFETHSVAQTTTAIPAEQFPPPSPSNQQAHDHQVVIVLPIQAEGIDWEVAALYQDLSLDIDYSSLAQFHSYLDMICFQTERDALAAIHTRHLEFSQKLAMELTDLNASLEQKIAKRTEDLANSNHELKQAMSQMENMQEHMIQTEKMSLLGKLVAGIAHEINTPIGVALTASTSLNSATQDIKHAVEDKKLTRGALDSYVEYASEAVTILVNNLYRASDLIANFKEVSVDQSHDELRQFGLRQYVLDVLSSLYPQMKRYTIDIDMEIDEGIELNSYPGAIAQIITNFVMNSMKHGFDTEQNHMIWLSAEVSNNRLYLTYRDDGKGIGKDILQHIFEPFFTTKRGEGGSGLGLNIVSNLVHQKLKGRIEAEHSEIGVHFIVDIPLDISA